MPKAKKLKTLKIGEETHRRLKSLGRKGETFDDVISRLLRLAPEGGPTPKSPGDRRALGKIARMRWKRDVESGRLKRTKSGWRVNPDVD